MRFVASGKKRNDDLTETKFLLYFHRKKQFSRQVWTWDIEAAWVSGVTIFSSKFDIVVECGVLWRNNNTKGVLLQPCVLDRPVRLCMGIKGAWEDMQDA